MLSTEIRPSAKDMARNMARRARKSAETEAENQLRAKAGDVSRWRSPRLLWPLFPEEV